MAGREAEAILNVGRTSVVRAAMQTPVETMCLSNFDLGWLPINNVQRLFFYTQPSPNHYSAFIQHIKTSLSSVLVHFYPLAGRLRKAECGRTEIECNNQGVELREASIDIPITDLEKHGFQRKPFFSKLVHDVNLFAQEDYSRPLLLIQVTAFVGGGICVGTTYHHVMVDGNSFWHFMTSWAECSRGLPISKPPVHDRTVFKRDKKNPFVSYKAHEISGAKIFKFVSENTCDSDRAEKPPETLQKWTEPIRKSRVTYSTFCFTEDMIRYLKQRSGASTSFVAVAAQFWRCVVRAREIPLEESVYFALLCDCRGRVKPPLPPTYFGNCLSPGLAQTTTKILINSDISFSADVIQKTIDSCSSEEQINYLIDWAESPDRDFLNLFTEAGWVYGTNVVSSPRFPFYEINHGWGKPSDVQVGTMNEIGIMYLSCAKDGGKSIVVSTCLPQQQMEVLAHLLFAAEE